MECKEAKKKMMKSTLKFSSASMFQKAFMIMRSLIVANLLGPELQGIKNTVLLIQDYMSYAQLGTINLANIETAKAGNLEEKTVTELNNTVFSFILLLAVALPFLIGIGVLLSGLTLRFKLLAILGAISVMPLLLYNFYLNLLLATKRAETVSSIIAQTAIIGFFLVVGGALLTYRVDNGIYGFFIGTILSSTYLFYRYRKALAHQFKIRYNIKKMVYIIRRGLPFFFLYLGTRFFLTIDRMVVITFLGAAALGYYSISLFFTGVFYIFVTSFGHVVSPFVLEKTAKHGKRAVRYVTKPTRIISHIFIGPLSLSFIFAPWLIKIFTPAYLPAVLALKLLLGSAFFRFLEITPSTYLISINKQWGLAKFYYVIFGLALILDLIAVWQGWGINGIALTTTVSYAVGETALIYWAYSHLMKPKQIVKELFYCYTPFVVSVVVLAAMELMMPNTWQYALLKGGIYTLVYLPFLYLIEKHAGVIKLALEQFKAVKISIGR